MITRIVLTSTLVLSAACGPEDEEPKEPTTMSPTTTTPSSGNGASTSRPTTAFVEGGAGSLGSCPIGIKSINPGAARIATAGEGRPETDQVVGDGDLLLACGKLFRVARVTFVESGGAVGGSRSAVEIETVPVDGAAVSLQPNSVVLTREGRVRLGPGKSMLEGLALGDGKATLVVVTGSSRQTLEVRPGEPFGVDDRRLRVLQILPADKGTGVTGWLELESL
jgi:hypothetical protein